MTHNWKPGDVALVTISRRNNGGDGGRYLALDCGSYGWQAVDLDDGDGAGRLTGNEEIFAISRRPLVVIDPESYNDRMRLIWNLRAADLLDPSWDEEVTRQKMKVALRALLEPEPEEPTGLGAVVRAGDGSAWVRIPQHNYNNWRRADAPETRDYWRSIPRPITVLSEGYEESTDE